LADRNLGFAQMACQATAGIQPVGSRSLKREITLRVLFYFIVGSFVDGLLLIAYRATIWMRTARQSG